MKTINDMTRKELEAVKQADWKEILEFDSLVILPQRTVHGSGYSCMAFIACKNNQPIARLSGGSDVVHINGIGGYGETRQLTDQITPISWSIDCLKKSKLLQLFAYKMENGQYCRTLKNGCALSSFEVFLTDKPEEKKP